MEIHGQWFEDSKPVSRKRRISFSDSDSELPRQPIRDDRVRRFMECTETVPSLDCDRETLVGELLRVGKRDRILHDIIPLRRSNKILQDGTKIELSPVEVGREIIKRFETAFQEKGQKAYHGGFFLARAHFKEGFEHIHVIHDCRFHGSNCKCSILHGLSIKRRTRRPLYESECTEQYWQNLTKYLILQGTGNFIAYTTGSTGIRFICEDDYVQLGGSKALGYDHVMEEQDPRITTVCEQTNTGARSGFTNRLERSQEAGGDGPAMPKDYKAKKVLEFLFQVLVCPPILAPNTPLWYDDQYLCNIDAHDKEFVKAVDLYKRQINNKILPELIDMYKDKIRLYTATDGNFSRRYKSVEESLSDLNQYLTYQFTDNETISDFLSNLYLTLTKNNGKKNTIWFKGPPSSAKSWFVRAIESLMITIGKCSVMNKTNNFPLSSCVCVNLIVLDELSYDPIIYTDILKLLMGGDQCSVSVKYCGDQLIFKTPIIVISNGECLPNSDAFNFRLNKYLFKEVNHLNLFSKELNPLAIVELFKQYGLWE